MNKNLKIVKKSEANNYFDRHLYFYKSDGGVDLLDWRISNLIKVNNLNSKSVLEIGCSTGIKLNQYRQILNSKINYGIDLSSKAIKLGKKNIKI
jgi:SAM-dependent methyltransferase